MLLRNPFSTTKRFVQKTIESFKSFFAGGHYQRLPKTPPQGKNNNLYSYRSAGIDMSNAAQTSFSNNKDLENFYNDFTDRWDAADKEKEKKKNKKKIIVSSSPRKPLEDQKDDVNGNFNKFPEASKTTSPVQKYHPPAGKRSLQLENKGSSSSKGKNAGRDQERTCLVARKLKELEMMDISNVDHVLDIEEVLHYYTRLTCPAYLDIVDRFFMEMYAEFLHEPPPVITPHALSVHQGRGYVRSGHDLI